MHIKKIFLLIFVSSLCIKAYAQEWKNMGVDELFQAARKEAFDGSKKKSREMLQYILDKSPGYADVRILLGRTYAWDGMREQAKEQFSIVLKEDHDNQDALNAMTDVLMWDDDYNNALETVNSGLKHYPNFEDFLYKKASILKNLDQEENAMVVINQLLQINPGSERGNSLRESIKIAQQRYSLGATGTYEYYSPTGTNPAYYAAISLGRSNDWGSSIGRINYSNRFGTEGLQGEVDLYPRIAPGVYAYLNYGFSKSNLFPDHRFGAEVYTKLPKSTEGSLGLRYLVFSPTKVTLYTGSIGLYYKSIWLSLRPFITPDKNTGTSVSFSLTLRRYFNNPETFLSFVGGMGYSPENILQSSSGFGNDAIYTLKSQRLGLGFQKLLAYNLIATISADFAHQELTYDVGNYMWITSLQAGIIYKF